MKYLSRTILMLSTMMIGGLHTGHAVQPVSDEDLAQAMSENSIILNDSATEKKQFKIEQDLALRETPAYQSLDRIYNIYPINFDRTTGEQKGNFATNFGSEFYSYRWEGNLKDIWDVNQHYRVFYNDYLGTYELNNLQGRVWIEMAIHCTNQRQWRGC
ncbi:MAG: hypothetical protein E6Q25_00260 [Acinetobacter sp.]|nr:MAG: hypothetical protein E6Q25_00260 [Acinetobacter sp.]